MCSCDQSGFLSRTNHFGTVMKYYHHVDNPMYDVEERIDPQFPKSLTDSQLQDLISDLRREVSADAGHCPSCGSFEVIRKGHTSSGSQRYRCKRCGIPFISGHPSVFPNSHIDNGIWNIFISEYLEGNTLRTCSKRCNVCLKTAFSMKSRLVENIRRSEGYPGVLFHGEVMLDECSAV